MTLPYDNETVIEKEVLNLRSPVNASTFRQIEESSTSQHLSTLPQLPPSTTQKPAKKATKKKSPSPPAHKGQSSSAANHSGHRRKKPHHQQTLAGSQSQIESVPDPSELKPEQSCLIGDVCMRNGKLGYCYKPHAPVMFDKESSETEDFYDMLLESCSHFFDENGTY